MSIGEIVLRHHLVLFSWKTQDISSRAKESPAEQLKKTVAMFVDCASQQGKELLNKRLR